LTSNVVLDGDVELDPFVDLDLVPVRDPRREFCDTSKSRCKVDGGVFRPRRRATSRFRDNVDVNVKISGGRSRP
jgi:hypothetical protein